MVKQEARVVRAASVDNQTRASLVNVLYRKFKHRFRFLALATVLSTALLGGNLVAAGSAGASPTLGNAFEVAGTASLDVGQYGEVASMSCSSAGDCSAVGIYLDSNDDLQAYVVSEVGGTWGTAAAIPSLVTLNAGGEIGQVLSISCSSAGNCALGGSYADSSGESHAFVVDQTSGTWGSAEEVPGFASLGTAGLIGSVFSVSCPSNGSCTAVGAYGDSSNDLQAFVVDETNGTWGTATEAPGTGSLNQGGLSLLETVDCASAGNCTAGGTYLDSSLHLQAFTDTEAGGTWSPATELPGTGAANVGGAAGVGQVSCTGAGACTAVGSYASSTSTQEAFVSTQTNGSWGTLETTPGINTTAGSASNLSYISCTSTGNCSAVGQYYPIASVSTTSQVYTVDEVNGTWGSAALLPGLSALNIGNDAINGGISCVQPGYCETVGSYTDAAGNGQAFVATETAGTWSSAVEVPGTSTLNAGGGGDLSVSCSIDGSCSNGGYYQIGVNSTGYLYGSFIEASTATFFAPSAPTFKLASTKAGELAIAVTGTTDNGGYAITSYQYSLNSGAWKSFAGTSTSKTLTGLKAGTTYKVRVRAVNELGDGATSATLSKATEKAKKVVKKVVKKK